MKPNITIPYVNVALQHSLVKDELLKAVSDILDKGNFILGGEVNEFEKHFAALCGVKYAVGVNSGTDALILALMAIDIGPGEEVITVPNSFVATASCIKIVGARPVFIDVRDDYNMDPSLIESAITDHTRAILPVHLTGRPADMEPIIEIAGRYNLQVIEDCAQAVAAEYKGKRVGSFGRIGCFSLHPLKTLNACGDGGVLTTNDAGLAAKLKIMRNLGLENRENCVLWSGNSRLDTLQAAILLVKLKYLDDWTEKRRLNAEYYCKHLADLHQVHVPTDKTYEYSVYHTYVIQAENRDKLRAFLAEKGIGTGIHYPIPIHLQTVAEELNYRPGSFPVTEGQANRILSLPVYPELDKGQLNHIIDSIHKFYQEQS
ncbi:MAG: DegT/DnrJ/EryC1/StrS family aminotransferase [Syntrophus sp. (in: bacteria)]